MLTIARVNLGKAGITNCQVRQGDIRDLPFAQNSIDVITLHQVLHYLDDPARIIEESARLLTAGGRLLIVDFQPHQVEQLRTDHAHRRLGFSDREVGRWCANNALSLTRVESLKPDSSGSVENLVVSLWTISKPKESRNKS